MSCMLLQIVIKVHWNVRMKYLKVEISHQQCQTLQAVSGLMKRISETLLPQRQLIPLRFTTFEGRKLQQTLQKGLYIQNGKKVIVSTHTGTKCTIINK